MVWESVCNPTSVKRRVMRRRIARRKSRTGMTQIVTAADGGIVLADVDCPARNRLTSGQAKRIADELAFRKALTGADRRPRYAQGQVPPKPCPPGYRWEDTPTGWKCIPKTKKPKPKLPKRMPKRRLRRRRSR